jgi:hypothetical protein
VIPVIIVAAAQAKSVSRSSYRRLQLYAPYCIFLNLLRSHSTENVAIANDLGLADADNISTVSAYYGPGIFVAWVLLALSASFTTVTTARFDLDHESFIFIRILRNMSKLETLLAAEERRAPITSPREEDVSPPGIDAEFLAAILYPIFAAFPICSLMSRGSLDGSYFAACRVVSLAIALSWAAVVLTWSPGTTFLSSRALIWAVLLDIGFIALGGGTPTPETRTQFLGLAATAVIAEWWVKYQAQEETLILSEGQMGEMESWTLFLRKACFGVCVVGYFVVVGWVGGVRSFVPRTEAKIGDPGQTAAVGLAVLFLAWKWKSAAVNFGSRSGELVD